MLAAKMGAQIEMIMWDRLIKTAEREQDWEKYLKLETKDEIVGQRYLKDVHTHLLFELSMVPAATAFAVGVNWYNHLYGCTPATEMVYVTVGVALLILYLLYQIYISMERLAYVRSLVIQSLQDNAGGRD
ncbi:hypothetical protein MalM25_07640 [Planctomycetes bacterium MalM25]|nr:hypothetical protein MalM25_07640 [Planctomycetes bacterium MalM25]